MASQLQFKRLRSWLSTFYDLYQVWSLGSLTTASFDTCMWSWPRAGYRMCPGPLELGLGGPHTDLKTLKRAEQPGLGFRLKAPAAVSCSVLQKQAGLTGLWLQCSGSGRQDPAGDRGSN